MRVLLWLPPSSCPAPFPDGPGESNWQQCMRSAADGWCSTGTSGCIGHAGADPVPASCSAAPRYSWPRDERGKEPPSLLGAKRVRQRAGELKEGSKPCPKRPMGLDCPAMGVPGAGHGGCCLANQVITTNPTGTAELTRCGYG